VERIGADTIGEQFATYTFQGEVVFRPGSLVGEPKGFGAACVFWLSLVLSRAAYGRPGWAAAAQVGLLLLALWFSASTTAWAGTILALVLGVLLLRMSGHAYLAKALPASVLLVVIGAALWLPSSGVSGREMLSYMALRAQVRFTERLTQEGPLPDLAERVALERLNSKPVLWLLGAGFGGISAYIAEELAGSSRLVLFPNNGLLGMICNFGLVGLAAMLYSFRRGLGVLLRAGHSHPGEARAMAFVGLACLVQCFIFAQAWLLSWAFGFLLAAEFRAAYGLRRPPARGMFSIRAAHRVSKARSLVAR
jgi:hypothetical protein